MRDLYPAIEPYNQGKLKVSELHTIHYEESGNPQGKPVIFLHGGGQTRHAWTKTAAALADRGWEVVTVDLRGHGDSGWSPTVTLRVPIG